MGAALITTNLRTKIRTMPGPAIRSLWRSELFSLVKLHLSRVPPADQDLLVSYSPKKLGFF
ncbi:hypothetical protein [Streptomyces sp. NPDC048106]|uniref:hypothetical protein n=1 Tax=Streptomyces sp. NPDC048106 TaxID=3155750 RepID=UPI003456FDD4